MQSISFSFLLASTPMRFDDLKTRKTPEELADQFTRYLALIIAFISVFFFFLKILFL